MDLQPQVHLIQLLQVLFVSFLFSNFRNSKPLLEAFAFQSKMTLQSASLCCPDLR